MRARQVNKELWQFNSRFFMVKNIAKDRWFSGSKLDAWRMTEQKPHWHSSIGVLNKHDFLLLEWACACIILCQSNWTRLPRIEQNHTKESLRRCNSISFKVHQRLIMAHEYFFGFLRYAGPRATNSLRIYWRGTLRCFFCVCAALLTRGWRRLLRLRGMGKRIFNTRHFERLWDNTNWVK